MKPVLDAIRVRRSHRSFVPDAELEDWQVDNLITAGLWAPSAMHYDVCNIIAVRDKDTRIKLAHVTPYALMMEKASLALVLIAEPEGSDWWVEDCSAAAENILIEAADMGLGACWVQVRQISEELAPERTVRKLLSIPDSYRVLCMIAVGIPAKEKSPHTQEEIDFSRLHLERF